MLGENGLSRIENRGKRKRGCALDNLVERGCGVFFIYDDDAPLAITGDRVNRECIIRENGHVVRYDDDDDDDAPQAITGDRVNRECYMQVRGRVHNSHLGACFCVARL